MSTNTDPFPGLDVSSDDYATTAAHDQHVGADATSQAVRDEAKTGAASAGTAPVVGTAPEVAEDDSDAEREKAGAARAARTRYTEEDFAAQKAGYEARVDEGMIWKQLLDFTPPFVPSLHFSSAVTADSANLHTDEERNAAQQKTKLDKKGHQTISAAVAELYFLERYTEVGEIVQWAKRSFEKDRKWEVQISKWEDKVRARMGG